MVCMWGILSTAATAGSDVQPMSSGFSFSQASNGFEQPNRDEQQAVSVRKPPEEANCFDKSRAGRRSMDNSL